MSLNNNCFICTQAFWAKFYHRFTMTVVESNVEISIILTECLIYWQDIAWVIVIETKPCICLDLLSAVSLLCTGFFCLTMRKYNYCRYRNSLKHTAWIITIAWNRLGSIMKLKSLSNRQLNFRLKAILYLCAFPCESISNKLQTLFV